MSIIARLHSKPVMIIATVTLSANNGTTAQTVTLCVLPPDVCPIGRCAYSLPQQIQDTGSLQYCHSSDWHIGGDEMYYYCRLHGAGDSMIWNI